MERHSSQNCNLRFISIIHSNYERHLLQHSPNCPFICDVDGCSLSFKSKYALDYHKKRHSGEKPFICTVEGCDKSYYSCSEYITCRFVSQSNLKRHLQSHSSVRQFHCPLCQCSYKHKHDMNRHIAKVHSTVNGFMPITYLHFYFLIDSDAMSPIIEENKKQREMIAVLIEQNKQLQEKVQYIINV